MEYLKILILSFLIIPAFPFLADAQCDHYADECKPHLSPYYSDGKYYSLELHEGQVVKLNYTFYGGSEYRILACGTSQKFNTTTPPGTLYFNLYDEKDNLIYSNQKNPESFFRDFYFNSTGNYRIELQFSSGAGCAILMIGFNDFVSE